MLIPLRTLEPAQIENASVYKKDAEPKNKDSETKSKWKKPNWRHEYNCGRQYQPSYNLAPTDITPVLVSAKHFDFDSDQLSKTSQIDDRVIVPMLWGMIPFWHTGVDYRKHGLTTNNCRLESMLQSKLYKNAFFKRQRCVVLCEGFYEWQTTDPKPTKVSERAAYFAYMPQKYGIKIEQKKSWQEIAADLNLLKMAALFDIWRNAEGDQIYSYSIITFESDAKFSWLHHRSPAILETDEQIADWLDFKRVFDTKHLLNILTPAKNLKWHRVSNVVNNAINKSEECNKPVDDSKNNKKPMIMNKMMESWLIVKKRKDTAEDEHDAMR